MNRAELLNRLKGLPFESGDYWLITGGAMVLYGLRAETGDIDLGCTGRLFEALRAQGYPVTVMPDGARKICFADDVEIFENWLYGDIEILEGIPVISLQGLIRMKHSIGREKDMRDIALIEAYISQKEKEG